MPKKNKQSKKSVQKLLDEKYELEKKLRNKKIDFWAGLVLIIFFFWTGIGLILGIIFLLFGISDKEKIEKRLVKVNYELSKRD